MTSFWCVNHLSLQTLFVRPLLLLAAFSSWVGAALADPPASHVLNLRSQTETEPGSGRYHRRIQPTVWKSEQTAIIVCDMWDSHHCVNAVRRVGELSPRMNELLNKMRSQGATIIHAPAVAPRRMLPHRLASGLNRSSRLVTFRATSPSGATKSPANQLALIRWISRPVVKTMIWSNTRSGLPR